ncbi:MAG TPA: hypothetical protein VHK91_10355 [Flavisolibacter sp.]|jgi:hypothetical protein|nr:hypothetical protein [Flavisolibacter sp.]
MKWNLWAIAFTCLSVLSCKKNVADLPGDASDPAAIAAKPAGMISGKYRLTAVTQHYDYPELPGSTNDIMCYRASGPVALPTSIQSNANCEGSPFIYGFWDARINYNSDKIVFISNKYLDAHLNASAYGIGNVIPVNDTIVFASVINGRIDYSRAGKLNAYYSKMQYYYNEKGQLSRIVNWTNTWTHGNRILDFRFTYDQYGNLLSWKDVSAYHVGSATYTYQYDKPVKNAYYDEVRPFIEPPFTILQQFGLLPDFNAKHLRKSALITNASYPEQLGAVYTDQKVDGNGNLVSYSRGTQEETFRITWEKQ